MPNFRNIPTMVFLRGMFGGGNAKIKYFLVLSKISEELVARMRFLPPQVWKEMLENNTFLYLLGLLKERNGIFWRDIYISVLGYWRAEIKDGMVDKSNLAIVPLPDVSADWESGIHQMASRFAKTQICRLRTSH